MLQRRIIGPKHRNHNLPRLHGHTCTRSCVLPVCISFRTSDLPLFCFPLKSSPRLAGIWKPSSNPKFFLSVALSLFPRISISIIISRVLPEVHYESLTAEPGNQKVFGTKFWRYIN